MCEIFTWEESQGRKREPLEPALQVTACATGEGMERHCFERAAYCSSTARNIHPGQWGVCEPEFSPGGGPVSLERSQFSPAAMLSHRAWNELWKVQPSQGQKKHFHSFLIRTQHPIQISLFSTLLAICSYWTCPKLTLCLLVHQYVLLC